MINRMAQRSPARSARTGDASATIPLIQSIAAYSALFCAALIAYSPALHGGLVWDDVSHVTAAALQSLHGLWRIWFELGATQQYYPLTHSAFWFEHQIWGDAVLGYHLVNVILHAASACLVVMIMRRLRLPGAWLGGFIFALHPVAVEAVAWISEQKSTLSGVLCLGAALTHLRFDQTRRKSTYFWALGLFVLALMSKTVTATLPAVLLVIFWWQRGRISWRRDLRPLIPWFGVAIPAGLFTAWVEATPRFIGAQGTDYALTSAQRLLLAGRVPWFYASKVFWPSNLMFIYPRWSIDPSDWRQYLFLLGLAVAASGFAWLARKNRGPLAGFLIFTGILFPVLGFLNVYPFRYSWVADHFQYLAALGIIVPVASGLTLLARRISPGKIGAVALAAIPLTALGAASWRQSGNYRDYETLFRETLKHNPDSAFLHNNLGVRLMLVPGGVEEAADEFQTAVRLQPDSAEFHDNLGLALTSIPGRMPDAISEYRKALHINPDFQAAHLNLGLALMSLPGRVPDAIAEYQKAITEYQKTLGAAPDYWQPHLNLGIAYSQLPGRQADAIAEFQTALRMKPDSALPRFHLGNVFQTTGRLQEAIEQYRAALRIDPGAKDARYELAYALARVPGRVPEAITECQELLRLSPNDGPGRELMASLVAFQDSQRQFP